MLVGNNAIAFRLVIITKYLFGCLETLGRKQWAGHWTEVQLDEAVMSALSKADMRAGPPRARGYTPRGPPPDLQRLLEPPVGAAFLLAAFLLQDRHVQIFTHFGSSWNGLRTLRNEPMQHAL
ncbi:MAG: hypothetical protein WBV51_17905 [Pseudolabrys sp.]|jgi:hypothetical protein